MLICSRRKSGPGSREKQTAMEHGKHFKVKSLALKGMCEHSGRAHGRRGWRLCGIFLLCFVGFVFFIFQRKKTAKGKKFTRYAGKFGVGVAGWKGRRR